MRQFACGNIQNLFPGVDLSPASVNSSAFAGWRSTSHLQFEMTYEAFCGGVFETNCYLVSTPEGSILFDAPQGACDWVNSRGVDLKLLLLTHGHIDHVQDVASIKQRFNCQIGCHPVTAPMISDREFFRNFGFELEIEPAKPDFFIDETPARNFLGAEFQVLEVPGHCPGSLCFFSRKDNLLIGGDVLFAGGVGRWDLPGGDVDLLFNGIRRKLFPLGDDVTVLPGHGPPTKIGTERQTNPFVS
jgi:glyoxylase-like metal-dependent hydrolase (beta-lactamase superfamily II)